MAKRRIGKGTEPKDSKRHKPNPANVEATACDNAPSYSRDPGYYFEDGSIILLLEGVLFKVHTTLLKSQSQVFEDMFTMPAGNVSSRTEGTSDQDPVIIPQPPPYGARANPSLLLDAIEYARTAQDHRLINDIQQLAYHYISASDGSFKSWGFMGLFGTPGLRENHPSIFGCIFSTLLRENYTVWEREPFTKLDRMTLFSAEVRLSPIPDSFRKDIHSPLFEKPSSLEQFRETIALKLCSGGPPCDHKCDKQIMDLWLKVFNDDYYEDANEAFVLAWLAQFRSEFVEGTQAISCCQNCSVRFIKQLDEDIESVYVRFGEYYREIE